MGAQFNADKVHPLEYCVDACGIEMEVLKKECAEFKLIQQYAINTFVDNNNYKQQIKSIVRINKKQEQGQFATNMNNRTLLFHGSKMSNMLGILSSGLRVQPMGA